MISQNRTKGNLGEDLACDYLVQHGYKIVERNFTAACGEVDVVAQEGKTLVFIEVKRRLSATYGLPQEAVTLSKQRKIAQTAAIYLKRHTKANPPFRFDVVTIQNEKVCIIKNAFLAEILM